MTATQPDRSERPISRRGLMRATAIGIGASAGVGAIGSTPAAAQDGEDIKEGAYTAGAYLLGGPAAGAVVAYGYIVDGPDDSEVSDAQDWEQHVDEFNRAQEDELTLEQTLASLERDIQLVENKAREEAIFKIYEQAVDSGSESDAEGAAEDAIADAYATVEKAILDSVTLRNSRFKTLLETYGGQSSEDIFEQDTSQDGTTTLAMHTAGDISTEETELVDGETYEYVGGDEQTESGSNNTDITYTTDPVTWQEGLDHSGPDNFVDRFYVTKPDPADYDSVDDDDALETDDSRAALMETDRWHYLLVDLWDAYDAVIDEVPDMIDSYYQPAADGEIDLTDIQGPAYLTDTAENAENFQEAALALRAMGFALADEASIVSVEVDGETSEFEGRLGQSVDDPNPLPVGSEIDPDNVPGSIYGAFNQENDDGETTGEIVEITEPFTIEEAEDGSDEITFENRELATSDSDLSAEEVQELFAENYEERENARDAVYESATSGGGGGGFLENSDQDWGVIAVGAGVAALGWGYISDSSGSS
ncbi:hypothetical protein U4E84_01665 [Halorubrum sp. AD140]|uniref:hypothetical protein n=1 Tax=Halorubrum sp. AD140 TaxID=3050073 RepID=UPI002ACCE1D4|nr:hypothetical protein [Halorubrum sp. AD140]MDZ5810062.1 hypothetical protein [Halorubrum sp. AD140]